MVFRKTPTFSLSFSTSLEDQNLLRGKPNDPECAHEDDESSYAIETDDSCDLNQSTTVHCMLDTCDKSSRAHRGGTKKCNSRRVVNGFG